MEQYLEQVEQSSNNKLFEYYKKKRANEKLFFYFLRFPFNIQNCPFKTMFGTTKIISSEQKLF